MDEAHKNTATASSCLEHHGRQEHDVGGHCFCLLARERATVGYLRSRHIVAHEAERLRPCRRFHRPCCLQDAALLGFDVQTLCEPFYTHLRQTESCELNIVHQRKQTHPTASGYAVWKGEMASYPCIPIHSAILRGGACAVRRSLSVLAPSGSPRASRARSHAGHALVRGKHSIRQSCHGHACERWAQRCLQRPSACSSACLSEFPHTAYHGPSSRACTAVGH